MYNTDEFLIELLSAVKCLSFDIKLPTGEIMAVAFPFFEDKIVLRYVEDTVDFNEDVFVKFITRLVRFPFIGNEVNDGVTCLEVGLTGASGEIVILVG